MTQSPRIVLGVDPGTRVLGWGVTNGKECIGFGLIKPRTDGEFSDRLVFIYDELAKVIDNYKPEESAVETIFFSKNAQSASKLGHARGVILLCLRRAGIQVFEYAPALIKRAVAGLGRADKRQVGLVVASALKLQEVPPEDASDALAVALAHVGASRFRDAVASSRIKSNPFHVT